MIMLDPRFIVCVILAFPALTMFAFGQAPTTPLPVADIVPLNIVELVTAVFTGIAAVGGIFVSIFLPILANRQKRTEAANMAMALELTKAQVALDATKLEIMRAQIELSKVKDTVVLVERNTNSMTSTIKELADKAGIAKGKAEEKLKGEETAKTLAEGQRQGMEQERASAIAAVGGAPAQALANSDTNAQAVTAAAAAAAAIAAPAAAAIAAPPAAAIAAPPAADIAAPPVVKAVVPPAVETAVKAAFEKERLEEKKRSDE